VVGKPQNGRKRALSRKVIQKGYRTRKKHEAAVALRINNIERLREASEREQRKLANSTVLYQLLVIDPPWDDSADAYNESGRGRAAANHYATMTLGQIKAAYPKLPAARHSLCYIWTPSAQLKNAIELLRFWGFAYSGCVVWDKVHIGKGRRYRMQAEFIVYGSKGRGLPVPVGGDKTPNLFTVPVDRSRGAHSRKPDQLYRDLARQYPGVAKLEMFARRPREGWDTHGNEV
jgi:N6-adenosine-specific RNA methylase IME4